MKYLRVGIPFFVVLAVIFGAFASYAVDNMPAFYANITALFGWLAISYDEYVTFRLNRSRDVSNTVA
jgi:uncharacterized membrane protein